MWISYSKDTLRDVEAAAVLRGLADGVAGEAAPNPETAHGSHGSVRLVVKCCSQPFSLKTPSWEVLVGRSGGLFVYLTCQQHDGAWTVKPRLHSGGDVLPRRGAGRGSPGALGPIAHRPRGLGRAASPTSFPPANERRQTSLPELSGDFSKFIRVKSPPRNIETE